MSKKYIDIKGYEGMYQISEAGQFRGIDRMLYHGKDGMKLFKGIELKKTLDGNGYLKVGLSKDNKVKNIRIHILLAKHFIPNPNNFKSVRHLNDNKLDNRLENLAWGTHADNVLDGKRNGVYKSVKGELHPNFGRKRGHPANFGKKGADSLYFKVVLDLSNGIFYYGTDDAANIKGINPNTLRAKLSGHSKNDTTLIYA